MLKKLEKQINDKIKVIALDIVFLKDNWFNSTKSYKLKTLNKARLFLLSLTRDFWNIYQQELEIPLIVPGIDGDIDLEWNNKKFHLLVSIPEDNKTLAGLYGNNRKKDEIKYNFNNDGLNVKLIAWLKRQA